MRFITNFRFIPFSLFFFCLITTVHEDSKAVSLEDGFANPPRSSGVRCWWWWLNSNVTKEAITKDLEAMKSKGFSGAMIFDAGGAEQRGNEQVPPGPTYGSPEWRELYKHALKEAERLGLILGLSIQSGWNLGGPYVTADYSAKQLTFSETQISGPTSYKDKLPQPNFRDDYYRDICVLAYPNKERDKPDYALNASSAQDNHPLTDAVDGDPNTFWVSAGNSPNRGPSKERPESIVISFPKSKSVAGIHLSGRKEYGPKSGRIESSNNGKQFETIRAFEMEDGKTLTLKFDPIETKQIRIVFEDAYDPRSPDRPRNVQVTELSLLDERGEPILSNQQKAPIRDLNLKCMYRELGGSAPDCRFLLNDGPSVPGEEDAKIRDILDLTDKMSDDGTLDWDVPEGNWTVLRFGYTPTNAHVSTYSADWHGRVIDYLSESAFKRYWNEVVDPLLDDAEPYIGTVLQQLETDSWECGGMNWTDDFREQFVKYRGYDIVPYLPVIAGKIVESREDSNRFLADFRKTLADCVADNHYQVFADMAHERGLQIQPESGGPHAGPFDAIKNLGKNDIVMGEFWVPSPHRPNPENRFFIKQSSSVAHVYGKKYVGAESFTSIGPHWDDALWKSQKPSADHEFCSGLNLVFFHTFTCSPKEMGLPGQEYFAGTHFNPQITWWRYSDAYVDFLNRCQFLFQQGKFVADALYYYGDHVPNLVRLKEDDPAGVLPGYDYDVCNEEILMQLKVENGSVVVPGGVRYRLLVLPDHKVLSLAALEAVERLAREGATILGPKPERLVSLVGGEKAQERFTQLADALWGKNPLKTGVKTIGKGKLIWGKTSRQHLADNGVHPDFIAMRGDATDYEYIHYTIDDADVYYVCNQTERPRRVTASFRIAGKQPELWDPITGTVFEAKAFQQQNGRTNVPLLFGPYGSCFVFFRKTISTSENGPETSNYPRIRPVQTISGPWKVSFDKEWGAPQSVELPKLISWTTHENEGVRFYSGEGAYTATFDFESDSDANKRYWLDLGEVKDVGVAAVRLNGEEAGIVWTKPFRIEITGKLKSGNNELQVSVVNSWRNRLVGDRGLPGDKRFTKTNITIRPEWELLESGLLGPVKILSD